VFRMTKPGENLFLDLGFELNEPCRLQSAPQKQIHNTGTLRLSPVGQAVGEEFLVFRENR